MASAAPVVAHPQTAWQVVWAAIPEVQQAFPSGQPPDNAGVRRVQDLPAIHSLVVSSSRRADARGFSVIPGNLVAAMVQVSGVTQALPCRKCASGFGLWAGCVTNPAQVS
ncbi:hypothetical protein FJTKL_04404 [Diaporthe vaccinii]|uniref:Uncharacterized protein n=1 Tax=Diaporthe vaccinii TaxID=105482 RepID=A0ABR4DT88_9PEZI